jgi:hypothetical protein
MRIDRDYALMPYQAYTLVPFFPLFQERGAPKPERPKADWEVRFDYGENVPQHTNTYLMIELFDDKDERRDIQVFI